MSCSVGANSVRPLTAKVITVSDRSFRGEREDLSGPAVKNLLERAGYAVGAVEVLPDEQPRTSSPRAYLCRRRRGEARTHRHHRRHRLCTARCTPEATIKVCEKLTPGIPEAMRAASMQITPKACLSRAAAGIRGTSLIINLPGSPKGACENLQAVLEPIEHGIYILQGGKE
ncbi:MAG: molybdenum cofactor biosynthesis protein B [Butyricicoccaceae bacterium]